MACSTLANPSGSSLGTVMTSSRKVVARLDDLSVRYQGYDLSLVDPGKRVVHVRNPHSLHASLNQLKSELRSTFDVSEQKMIAVRENFREIPKVIREMEEIFKSGNTSDQGHIDALVGWIGSQWEVCLKHTKFCADNFRDTRLLLEEMRELCAVRACSLKTEMDEMALKRDQLASEASSRRQEMNRLQAKVNEARELVVAKRNANEKAIQHKIAITQGIAIGIFALVTAPVIAGPVIAAAVLAIKLTADELEKAEHNLRDEERWYDKCKAEIKEIQDKIDQLESQSKKLEESRKAFITLNEFLNQSTAECAKAMQMWVNAESFFQQVSDRVAQNNNSRVVAFLSASQSMIGKIMSWLKIKHIMKKGNAAEEALWATEDMLY